MHLALACLEAGDEVFAASRSADRPEKTSGLDPRARRITADVREEPSVVAAIQLARPDRIFHLAGHATSRPTPLTEEEVLRTNVLGTLHVLRAVKAHAPPARVLYVGSAEEYGRSERQPLEEDARLLPITPYGVSRAAASLVAQRFALAEKLHVVRTRSFNHTGPGQAGEYAVASFAHQLVAARARGERRVTVSVGDLSVRRDFSGVRAVVRAYRALLEKGTSGAVYNVCSGSAPSLGEILERLGALAGVAVDAVPDPARMRPVDVPVLHGDPTKLEATVGFSLRGSLDEDLGALVAELSRPGRGSTAG
jgi:GDP-4-dehydro-6-deoxy-D-mannose reductase